MFQEGKRGLIVGSGFIGSRIAKTYPDFDVCKHVFRSREEIERALVFYKPDFIINALGRSGRNIDWCELHPEETQFANVTVPTWMARECEKRNIHMIHLGTGCLYEGE